jgi:ATP-dependent DNA helicase RecQ
MGVDKPNIRTVLHYDIPGSLEALSQEVGRAGRDGLPSQCWTFFSKRAVQTQQRFIDGAYPPAQEIRKLFNGIKALVNGQNICHVTPEQLAKAGGMRLWYFDSAMGILIAAGVVDRPKAEEKNCFIKFVGDTTDARFQSYKDAIESGGVYSPSGFWEVDVYWIADTVQTSYQTVTKYLKQWAKDGFLEYVPPLRNKPIRLLGDICQVEFERLVRKAEFAYQKLADVIKYCELPDSEKHAFIEAYFGIPPNQ